MSKIISIFFFTFQQQFLSISVRHFVSAFSEDDGPEASTGYGPAFYILVGSATAALLIFGVLLTYFLISVRTQKHGAHLPSVQYKPEVRQQNRAPPCGRTLSLTSPGSRTIDMSSSARRYSKDKTAKGTQQKDETIPKKSVIGSQQAHNNNFYISYSTVGK